MQTTPQQRIDELTGRGWWGERTLLDMFDDAAAASPDHPALIDQFNRSEFTDGDALRLTFREVDDAAARLATTLHAGGIRQDDIVVVQLPNIAELPVLYLALARLGAIISPVPIQYGPFELEKAREVLDPAAFISLSNFKGKNFAADHSSAFADGCSLFAFGNDIAGGFTALSLTEGPTSSSEYASYANDIDISANDILSICWTSGTTGQPKGVPRSHNMWMASGRGAHDVADMRDGEAILNPFPMVNMAAIGGFLFPWLMRGATLVLHHPLDLPVFLKQIELEKIAYTIAPPAVLNMLLKKRELLDSIDMSSLRAIGSGSAPLSEWMVAEWQNAFGIAILNVFGSNEGICLASDQHDLPDPADRARYFPRFGVEGYAWRNRAGAENLTRLVD
ncbi:MAG: acyl--CoA ligase, partial [Gammaproteobacteria bacterium]|nr:acyl--CoA ligase [Gammaproteobacteria bacterium]